jgi:hypothetical protein
MRSSVLSSDLRTALADFLQAAAALLRGELEAGAEIGFDLAAHHGRSGSRATLYAYEPLTDRFIAAREGAIEQLSERADAVRALEGLHGLERYLSARGRGDGERIIAKDLRRSRAPAPARGRARACANAALRELLLDVFEGQTDFELRPERLQAALDRLQCSVLADATDATTIVATLHGLTLASRELVLTEGLSIAVPDAPGDAPEAARIGEDRDGEHLLVSLTLQRDEQDEEPLAVGRAVLWDLLRALRLFGDGRVVLGALAWMRCGGEDGRWRTVSIGSGGHPHGMLVVTAEQEDELRTFCKLVSRRCPEGDELAWALRRFELGCERPSPFEGLSDHLLALRALLEPEGPASGLLAGRVAALCATPEQRGRLTARMTRAIALERAIIAGSASESTRSLNLARAVSDHLRALLRDMICGHLKADLVGLADELLAPRDTPSGEQVLGDAGKPREVVHVLV